MFAAAQPRLRRMIDARLDHKLAGRVDPSDIVQEAFIEASRRLPEYLDAPTVSPFIWLRHVTRQTLADEYRRHAVTVKRAFNREAFTDEFPVQSDSMVLKLEQSVRSPHSAVASAELTSKLLEIVDSMSIDDREILSLKQLEQLTFAEVAVELNISIDAAMKRFQRAILRLGKLAAHLNRMS